MASNELHQRIEWVSKRHAKGQRLVDLLIIVLTKKQKNSAIYILVDARKALSVLEVWCAVSGIHR